MIRPPSAAASRALATAWQAAGQPRSLRPRPAAVWLPSLPRSAPASLAPPATHQGMGVSSFRCSLQPRGVCLGEHRQRHVRSSGDADTPCFIPGMLNCNVFVMARATPASRPTNGKVTRVFQHDEQHCCRRAVRVNAHPLTTCLCLCSPSLKEQREATIYSATETTRASLSPHPPTLTRRRPTQAPTTHLRIAFQMHDTWGQLIHQLHQLRLRLRGHQSLLAHPRNVQFEQAVVTQLHPHMPQRHPAIHHEEPLL